MTVQFMTDEQEAQIMALMTEAAEAALRRELAKHELTQEAAMSVLEKAELLVPTLEQSFHRVLMTLGFATPPFQETEYLRPVTTAIIPPRVETFDALAFFKRKDVPVGNGPRVWAHINSIIALYVPTLNRPELSYVVTALKGSVPDRDIQGCLPEQYFSNIEDIAFFLEGQPRGEKGVLATGGQNNIFYIEDEKGKVCIVTAIWIPIDRAWLVNEERPKEGESFWSEGDQILFPGVMLL